VAGPHRASRPSRPSAPARGSPPRTRSRCGPCECVRLAEARANYLQGIPSTIEEASEIDGAGAWRTVLSVILPMAKPGLFTVGVFTFTASWSEFLMALTFNSENSFRTTPVGIALFGTQFTVPFAQIFAASVAATIPIVILVLVFRRSIVSGLTSGAVKG